jgi:class 3 adenylate cyclase
LNHFDIIRAAVTRHEGAIVKTMGDAVMAVFRRPVNALLAMQDAQASLAQPPAGAEPLALKVGIHQGACIAVNLNDRLDYFGTTVNIAARIAALSTGDEILVSDVVWNDPEVSKWRGSDAGIRAECFETRLRGYEETISLWRLVKLQNKNSFPLANPFQQ